MKVRLEKRKAIIGCCQWLVLTRMERMRRCNVLETDIVVFPDYFAFTEFNLKPLVLHFLQLHVQTFCVERLKAKLHSFFKSPKNSHICAFFYASSICVCNIDCQESIQDIVLQSFIDLHNNIVIDLKEFQFFQRGFSGFIPSSIISTYHPLQP
jgi:hypothetical protein